VKGCKVTLNWLTRQSTANPSPERIPCYQGKEQGNSVLWRSRHKRWRSCLRWLRRAGVLICVATLLVSWNSVGAIAQPKFRGIPVQTVDELVNLREMMNHLECCPIWFVKGIDIVNTPPHVSFCLLFSQTSPVDPISRNFAKVNCESYEVAWAERGFTLLYSNSSAGTFKDSIRRNSGQDLLFYLDLNFICGSLAEILDRNLGHPASNSLRVYAKFSARYMDIGPRLAFGSVFVELPLLFTAARVIITGILRQTTQISPTRSFSALSTLSRSRCHTGGLSFAPPVKAGFTCQSEAGISFCGLQSSTATVILPFLA